MNYRLIIGGIVLIAVIVFGFWFWGEFAYNQQELASIPVTETDNNQESATQTSQPEDSASLQTELDSINIDNLDSEKLDVSGL